MKNYTEAKHDYRRALLLQPHDIDIYQNLSLVCQLNEDWEEALSCFSLLAQIEPEQPQWPYRKALLMQQLGLTDDAIKE